MMCNSTQYEPIEYPTPLFEQTELNVCLENDQDHKTYLKHVAHFVKDAETGHYNIYEASYLDACWKMTEVPRINKNSPLIRIPKPISFEPKRGKFRYAGRSDNEQLIAVKVWKYVQKEEDRRAKVKRKIKR